MDKQATLRFRGTEPTRDTLPLITGYNDSGWKRGLKFGQAQTMQNWYLDLDGSIRTSPGREYIAQTVGSGSNVITGVACPPRKIELCKITDANRDLYISYDGTNYTASVAAGYYYTYDELATALAAALTAAVAGSWSVDWDSTTSNKFTVSADAAIILLWNHNNTTLADVTDIDDRPLFGFRWSVEDSTGVGGVYTVTSEWETDSEPPGYGTKKLVWTDGNMYDEDKTEITSPAGNSITPSSDDPAWVWDHDRLYFSNRRANYLMRDRYIRKPAVTEDVHFLRRIVSYTTAQDYTTFMNYGGGALHNKAGLVLSNSAPWARLEMGHSNDAIVGLTYIKLYMKRNAGNGDSELIFYYENPGLGIFQEFHRAYARDIATAAAWVELNLDPHIAVRNMASGSHYITVHLDQRGTENWDEITIYGDDSGLSKHGFLINSDGGWDAWAGEAYVWEGEAHCKGFDLTGKDFNVKFAFVNKEGFETELSELYNVVITAATRHLYTSVYALLDYDWDYLRVYRTLDGGSVYYRVFQVPRSYFAGETNLALYMAGDDTYLAAQTAAPSVHANAQMPYGDVVNWQGRSFAIKRPGYENLLYWTELDDYGNNLPEHWNDVDNYTPVGKDGLHNTAQVPLQDRLLIFQRDHIHVAIPGSDGQSFPIEEISDKAVGTLGRDSPVSVLTPEGLICFFQGPNGHFYITDGLWVKPLSFGEKSRNNLSTLVGTMNLSALDKTRGIYVPAENYIIWMVCTGSNTTPDTAVLYHLDSGIFTTDNMASNYLAIESSQVNGSSDKIVGSVEDDLIYVREDDTDDLSSGSGISATLKTLAMDFGDQWAIDNLIDAIVTAKAQTAGTTKQEMTFKVYLDESGSAQVSSSWELGTSVAAQLIDGGAAGKVMELEITANTAALGWAAFDEISLKVGLQETGVRRAR